MKVVLFTLFSLMCLQVVLVASAHISLPEPDSRTQDSKQETRTELASTCNKNALFRVQQRVNFMTCFWAFKDLGSTTWQGWGIFKDKQKNENKTTERKLKCHDTTSTPEELENCLKAVEEEYKKVDEALNRKLFELMPKIATTLFALISCFV